MKKLKAKSTNGNHKGQKLQKKKVLQVILGIVAALAVCAVLYFGFGIFKEIEGFSKDRLLNKQASVLVDVNGEEYFSYAGESASKNVKYEDIPQVMIDAVVSAEDSRFFEHNGFDLPRIVKALVGNISAGGITSGGSTITQQVIKKSYYPDAQRTIERKVGEIILSIEATSQTTKEEILELYLNKIYFGYGNKTIGLYSASRYYFDKDVQDLTLPEAALLAGTLNSPNQYDPFINLDKAQKRRNTILDLMEMHGYISEEECEITKAIPVENTLKSNPVSFGGQYQAYADRVYREVEEKTGLNPQQTSMKIHTYVDIDLQKKLDDIASGKLHTYLDDQIEIGSTVVESKTGHIVGIISGRNYSPLGLTYAYANSKEEEMKTGQQYGQRNSPGSSLKPIIAYASAFEFLDYSTAHYVHDVPLSGSYNPKNWNGKFHGDITIKEALAKSWNLAAIQTYLEVLHDVGADKISEYMSNLGFDMYGEESAVKNAGFAIGSWNRNVSTEEEAGAYAAIANGGTYIEPHTVSKIELLTNGDTIDLEKQYQAEKKTAISEEAAFMIRDVMTSYVKGGGGAYGGLNIGYNIGAKTGTSTHGAGPLEGRSKDNWMAAFSPDYAWSVWVGYDAHTKKELVSAKDANQVAALIAKYAHDGHLENKYPGQPKDVVKTSCISGIYPYVSVNGSIPKDRVSTGYFKKSNMPKGSAESAALNTLDMFKATANNNRIDVQFTPYDPKSMTESSKPTKVYKTSDGRSYKLPYLGDIKQIYGKVVYVVEVTNSSGKVVHKQTSSKDKFTLNFNPGSGSYTVKGYYAYENSSTYSNAISQSIEFKHKEEASYQQIGGIENNILTLDIKVPEGSTIVVKIEDIRKDISSSQRLTIDLSSLTPGHSYTVYIIENTASGETKHLSPLTIKI